MAQIIFNPRAGFPDCNSASLLPLIPCYECLDMRTIQALKVLIMCKIVKPSGVTCSDASELRRSAACLTCLSDDDLDRLEVAGLCALASLRGDVDSCDPQTLLEEAKCLACLSKHDLHAIYEWLFCQFLSDQIQLL